ncbi:MAG: hypothetical protein J5517_04110 [Eubacterium sp.]|nr:hypothetical protein [Eubacterium sp.]
MIINCFYDEDMRYADIIYLPDLGFSIDDLKEDFFKWMFNKNIDHKYWIIVDGEKKACKYGVDAFIDWFNNTYLPDNKDKAYIIYENTEKWDEKDKILVF